MTEICREYAEALFAVAAENGETKAVSEGLALIRKQFFDLPDYFVFLTSPGIPKSERLKSIDEAFSGEMPDCLVSFLGVMCSKGKLKLFDGAADEYEKLYSDSKNTVTAHATSVIPLSESEKLKLKAKLESLTGKNVLISYSIDKSLIGGIKLEIEGSVFDGSVRQRLHDLKEVIDK